MIDPSRFHVPDFVSPIDVESQRGLVIPGATVKGMQLQAICDECKKRGRPLKKGPYRQFLDYPGQDLVDLLALAAGTAWHGVPTREALRRLGRLAYPTLKSTLIGRVVFGVIGDDFPKLLPLIKKGYDLSASHGKAELLQIGENEAVVRLRDIYTFVDSWHVGILEGAMLVYGHDPDVRIKVRSPTSADFLIRWRSRT